MRIEQKGAVPIPYIIALVLAIVVISIIVYWLFFSGGEFGSLILEKGCDAKKMTYCNDVTSSSVSAFSAPCISITDSNKGDYYAPECCSLEKFHGSIDICN